MTWATVADVNTKLGITVSATDILMASAIIDTYANRTEAASAAISPRDLGHLQMATIWQAVWYAEQPGAETRQIAAKHSQDGVEVDYAGTSFNPKEYPAVLAPLAARALRNLSWKGTRTLRTPHIATPVGSIIDFANETGDARSQWSPT